MRAASPRRSHRGRSHNHPDGRRWNGELRPSRAPALRRAGVPREWPLPHSQQLGLAVLVGLVTEALWVGICDHRVPRLRSTHPNDGALVLSRLAVVILAVAVVENAAVMSMVSLSEAYTKASAAEARNQLQMVKIVVGLRAKLGALHGSDLRRWRNLRVLRSCCTDSHWFPRVHTSAGFGSDRGHG